MALIDTSAGVIVIRIAYDGEAHAGKTTNLLALSRSLSRAVYTPPQPGERTLYFDWLEYTGGLFDGMQVRCEVVSVPGQEMLTTRRELLVNSADVVVHVVDMSTASLPRIEERIRALRSDARTSRGVPRGVLVQANKCDLPHALPLSSLRDLCEGQQPTVGLREAVAQAGSGVRETFVFAVRLALDRVQALRQQGALEERATGAGGGEALLSWLRANEGVESQRIDGAQGADDGREVDATGGVDVVDALGAIEQVLAENAMVASSESSLEDAPEPLDELPPDAGLAPPELPDPGVPTGMIWPPLEGRMLLEQVTSASVALQHTSAGAWVASVGERWLLHSARDAEFPSLEAARRELLQSARAHSSLGTLLSHPRAIVVAATGHGTWRLWQIVRLRPNLRELLSTSLHVADPRRVAEALARVGTLLVQLHSRRSEFPLLPPCTLDTVGAGDQHVEFVGLLSSLALVHETSLNIPEDDVLLRRELLPVVRDFGADAAALVGPLEALRETTRDVITQRVTVALAAMLRERAS